MPIASSGSSQLLYNTVRIQCVSAEGEASFGTGFFYSFPFGGENLFATVVVTNTHVIENASRFEFFLHERRSVAANEPTGGLRRVVVQNEPNLWTPHPGGIDLCAMPADTLDTEMERQGALMYRVSLSQELIPAQAELAAMFALEQVVMPGYPISLWDDINNHPLLRRGITASHPAANWCGKNEGVIDIAALPGCSGSPILLFDDGSYVSGESIVLGSRVKLLGVQHAVPVWTANTGPTFVATPTTLRGQFSIPLHLGLYIKASELLVLTEHLRRTADADQ